MRRLAGIVAAVNYQASREPGLVKEEPYNDGWLMVLEPPLLVGLSSLEGLPQIQRELVLWLVCPQELWVACLLQLARVRLHMVLGWSTQLARISAK